jgi:tRNA-Thr(GGU) m(6)t(6)A37 methyltransferase TsaA
MRPGEVATEFDPANTADDARLVFIGAAETPWTSRKDCPHNLRQARERGGRFFVRIDRPWRPGLKDFKAGDPIIVLYWMARASRNLVIQAPRHSDTTKGVFSLRSPARPNPIALGTVRIISIDAEAGRLEVDALDCLNGTPIIDLKPWIDRVDVPV